ncbi:MAG: hypothetical protein K6F73_07245 [Lachnospiraceae bacterium]|nr:hypothetical protein [Lachnospiraceae bacterium]
MDIAYLDDKGLSTSDGIGYTGGKEKYISALQRYFKGYEQNVNAVRDMLFAGDTEGYAIKVHSLKSNSKMIGAKALADLFEELELAAKNNDTALISEKTEGALTAYGEVIDIIRPIGEAESVFVPGELSGDEAKKTVDELLSALDDFDDELSLELVNRLKGYPFRITQKEKLREAADFIENFMYDRAAEIINEIIPSIEG